MNKKILVVCILAVFLLVAISFSTAVSSNTTTDEKRESPLFRVRARRAIGERLGELKEIIKARFIGERVFFLPFTMREGRTVVNLWSIIQTGDCYTCGETSCGYTCARTLCGELKCEPTAWNTCDGPWC